MASIKYYPNGAGGTYGADLATIKPTYQSGVTWYVGNAVSTASNANIGKDRDWPLLTLQQAVTNASAGDIIVVLASHSETISATVTVAKAGLSIVGEGIGSTIPRLTNGVAGASGPMISFEDDSMLLDNFYFPGSTNANARERVQVIGGNGIAWLQNLSFECSANDANRSVYLTSTGPNVVLSSTFTCTGLDAGPGIQCTGEIGLMCDSVVFDAGSFRWYQGTAFYQNTTAVTGMRMTNISLLNGSNMLLPVTGATGVIHVSEQSGDSAVIWTP